MRSQTIVYAYVLVVYLGLPSTSFREKSNPEYQTIKVRKTFPLVGSFNTNCREVKGFGVAGKDYMFECELKHDMVLLPHFHNV